MKKLAAAVGIILPALLAFANIASAQDPTRAHRSLRTEHFHVHFTPELEPLARRAAASAERAYERLSAELVMPRGPIDLLVADNVDYANGSATPFPTNRIVVYAHPPIDLSGLRFVDDWIDLVVTHELAHVFHLDRSRGMWRGLQYVFGRAPILFPNAYTPRWLTEGIATYYESRLTGAGRVAGSHHATMARAAAVGGRLPRIDQVNVATPVFPGGEGVYIYGSLFIDHIARTYGADKVRALIERQSVHPVPFILDRIARNALGVSYSAAWDDFTASLAKGAGRGDSLPMPGWRDLSPPTLAADFLRWSGDGRIVYTGAAPKRRFGAWSLDTRAPAGAEPDYLGRRNGRTPHARTADGTLVYAQPDYVDPHQFRGDLYLERNGDVERVTRGARLSAPDARADGRVVIVEAVSGGSRLILYDIATGEMRPVTSGGPDEFWAEPRWSPDGSRIAAARWRRGGASAIAILDAEGAHQEDIGLARAVQSAPSWSPDGRFVLFSSDREQGSEIYLAEVGTGTTPRRISSSTTAMYEPVLSPDGSTLAAVRLAVDGFRIGVAPFALPAPFARSAPSASSSADSGAAAAPGAAPGMRSAGVDAPWLANPARTDTVTPFAGAASGYSAFRQLLPRYWFPVIEGDTLDTRIGAYTSGSDILGRHSYVAQIAVPVEGRGTEGGIAYQFAGLTQPLIGVSAWQTWAYRGYVADSDGNVLARFDRRSRDAFASATFLRPRVRSSTAFSIGGGAEWRRTSASHRPPITLPEGFYADSVIPRLTAGLSYVRTVSAPYAISPEDGFTLSLGATNRWPAGTGSATSRTVVATGTGYRSFDIGGFARHVAALRVAGGVTDTRTTSELEVGGVSGSQIPVAFGLTAIGEGRRTFAVRGFEERTLIGTHAWAASAEYRAPLALLARGKGLLPLFLDRTSVTAFADAGSAWCPTFSPSRCAEGDPHATIGSVGAEASLVAAIGLWDAPFRLRLGVAVPVLEAERAARPATVYLTSGLSF